MLYIGKHGEESIGFWNNVGSEERKFSSFYFLKYIKFFHFTHAYLCLNIFPEEKL